MEEDDLDEGPATDGLEEAFEDAPTPPGAEQPDNFDFDDFALI